MKHENPNREFPLSADAAERKIDFRSIVNLPEMPMPEKTEGKEEESKDLWHKMSHLILIEFSHERSPPMYHMNPFENPPINFEYRYFRIFYE